VGRALVSPASEPVREVEVLLSDSDNPDYTGLTGARPTPVPSPDVSGCAARHI